MRKVVLLIASLAAVVLLAVLVHVADGDDGVTYRGSYEQLKERPGKDHAGKGHGHRHHPKKAHHPRRLEPPSYVDVSCHLDGKTLVLDYTYGVGDRVAPFFDIRGDRVVAGVRVVPFRGARVDIGLLGQARFALQERSTSVSRPDGTDLPCPVRKR